MPREQDNVLAGGGEGASWSKVVDADGKRAGQRTSWRWRGSVMVSDCRRRCEESRTTYFLEVERGHESVRLCTRMRKEQDNVLPEVGEGV